VAARLRGQHPGLHLERVVVQTVGDRVLDTPLARIGDKGLFTKELEKALRDGEIDVAVHSLKDLPTRLPDGLALHAVLEREDARDALVAPAAGRLDDLPARARVGTSSLRRRAQLLALRPDLEVADLRGNVPTRLDRLDHGDYAAIVMAYAGLLRLGLGARATEVLGPERMLPAVGQGALGLETRAGDERVGRLLAPLEHPPTRLATTAERALLAALEGGCQVPIGALGEWDGDGLVLHGLVSDLDGREALREVARARVADEDAARRLGAGLAGRLEARGARRILEAIADRAVARVGA
jgi:hydroxymethylbilane synthase